MEWQDIETAPKDGTIVLMFWGNCTYVRIETGTFNNDKYAKNPRPYFTSMRQVFGKTAERENPPTHWMPLPPPPTGKK